MSKEVLIPQWCQRVRQDTLKTAYNKQLEGWHGEAKRRMWCFTYKECISTVPTHHSSSIWLNWQGRLSWLLLWNQHHWTKSNDAPAVLRTLDTHVIKLAKEKDDVFKQLTQSLPNIFMHLNYNLLVKQLMHPVLVTLQSIFSFKNIRFPLRSAIQA